MVAFGFIVLFLTLPNAVAQLFNQEAALPIIGHWPVYAWVTEIFGWLTFIGIAALVINRFVVVGTGKGRFFGSRTWQAVYVEFTILAVGVCIMTLRALEYQLLSILHPETDHKGEFPLSWFLLPPRSATRTPSAPRSCGSPRSRSSSPSPG